MRGVEPAEPVDEQESDGARHEDDAVQVVPAHLVRSAVAGPVSGTAGGADTDPAGQVDPLLLRDGDPDATARMTAEDFDPEDTADPDDDAEQLDLAGCALAISVDRGKVDVALVAGHGELVAAQRIPSAGHGGAADPADGAGFQALFDAIDDVLHAVGLDPAQAGVLPGIGVAMAAGTLPARSTGRRQAPTADAAAEQDTDEPPPGSVGWQPEALCADLLDRYGLPVVRLAPAAAAAAGEHWRGAARGRRSMLGVVVGHGIDGAVVIDGRLVVGTTGNAGHVGHMCVDPYGPACVCGGRGCLQAVAGGSAIAAWARRNGVSGAGDARSVADAAQRGDPVALATFRRAGEAVGQAVAGVVTLLDLDVVVVGGPLAAAGPVLFDPINDGYHRYAALGYAAPPRVVPALLGRDAGLVGAAAAVLEPSCYPGG